MNSKKEKKMSQRRKQIFLKKGEITQKKERQRKTKNITYGILIFMICLLYLTGFSFAKNIEHILLKSNTSIAEPIFLVEGGKSIQISEKDREKYYEFTIRNYEGEKISDMDLRYFIEINPIIHAQTVSCQLFRNGEEVHLENQKTELIEIPKEVKKEHQYQLKITYQQDLEKLGQDIFQEIQLKVHSEQQKG